MHYFSGGVFIMDLAESKLIANLLEEAMQTDLLKS
jgi:hypothetical protein